MAPKYAEIVSLASLMTAPVSLILGSHNPFGRNDQQEVVAYLCHTAHMAAPSEIEAAFDFVTYNAARALRLHGYGLEPGCTADLNVLAAPTTREVLRLQQPPTWVIRQGQVLARNQLQRELMRRQGSGLSEQSG